MIERTVQHQTGNVKTIHKEILLYGKEIEVTGDAVDPSSLEEALAKLQEIVG
jgi:hypothetical protein